MRHCTIYKHTAFDFLLGFGVGCKDMAFGFLWVSALDACMSVLSLIDIVGYTRGSHRDQVIDTWRFGNSAVIAVIAGYDLFIA
jgi:hypothetical protein